MMRLRRLWARLARQHPGREPPHRANGEREMARRRLTRVQERLNADLAQLSQDIEDGWRRK